MLIDGFDLETYLDKLSLCKKSGPSILLEQGCGNSRIFYLSKDKLIAKMYLSIENFTCPKEQISLYRTVLKQFIISKTV